jgi:hypothetical protein
MSSFELLLFCLLVKLLWFQILKLKIIDIIEFETHKSLNKENRKKSFIYIILILCTDHQ